MIRGQNLNDEFSSTGLGAQLIAVPKVAVPRPLQDPSTVPVRPVQNVDAIRMLVSAALLDRVIKRNADVQEFFLNEADVNGLDPQISQYAHAKDACTSLIKSVQCFMETSQFFTGPEPQHDSDFPIIVQIDIQNFFPTVNRQVIFDMLAGTASCNYPALGIDEDQPMPSHPNLQLLLPFFFDPLWFRIYPYPL